MNSHRFYASWVWTRGQWETVADGSNMAAFLANIIPPILLSMYVPFDYLPRRTSISKPNNREVSYFTTGR